MALYLRVSYTPSLLVRLNFPRSLWYSGVGFSVLKCQTHTQLNLWRSIGILSRDVWLCMCLPICKLLHDSRDTQPLDVTGLTRFRLVTWPVTATLTVTRNFYVQVLVWLWWRQFECAYRYKTWLHRLKGLVVQLHALCVSSSHRNEWRFRPKERAPSKCVEAAWFPEPDLP
jgi:hypothetical protein